ncbi:Dicer-like, partial [Globisporangium splendens]
MAPNGRHGGGAMHYGETPLRDFQREVVELAREQNVVMVGDTGIGKTFVAIALLSEQDYSDDKRAFFLAPTRQLVIQITSKVQRTSTLACKAYFGQEVELWDDRQWDHELRTTRVFVCTPEIVRSIIEKGYVNMNRINLLVFDECHHVTKRHPYAQLIKMYDPNDMENMPRIFGTTACPTRRCAEMLHATLKRVELDAVETMEYAATAPIIFETYPKQIVGSEDDEIVPAGMHALVQATQAGLTQDMEEEEARICAMLLAELQEVKVLEVYGKLLKKGRGKSTQNEEKRAKLVRRFVRSCFNIYKNLGAWCYYRFVELEIERLAMSASLLIAIPGSMFGLDKDAVKTILLLKAKRSNCNFSATIKVAKIEDLIRTTLFAPGSETAPDEFDEDEDDDSDDSDSSSDATNFLLSAIGEGDGTTSNEFSDDDGGKDQATKELSLTKSKQPLQGIVFVHTRSECRVLTDYLNEKFGNDEDDDAEDEEENDTTGDHLDPEYDGASGKNNLCACMLGQANVSDTAAFNLPSFQSILSDFESSATRLLISTSVSVEGVDFPLCGLVIVSDRINTPRMLIQLRGRARHEDGVVYYLSEEDDLDHHVHFRQLMLEADAINRLDFSHDKEESLLSLPRSIAAEKLQGHMYFPEESRLQIESTGAVLDLDSSIQCVNQFCQALPASLFTVDYKTMYSFSQSVSGKTPVFKAKLQLPPELEIEPFESEFMFAKTLAKASVAFQAGRALWEKGLLDDSLNSVYRKSKGKIARSNQNLAFFLERING